MIPDFIIFAGGVVIGWYLISLWGAWKGWRE